MARKSKATPAADDLYHDTEYAVGYGRPPKENQFKPGVSGNPKGRPKGRKDLSRVSKDILNELIYVTENGRRKRMTRLEALIRQTVNNAFKGDHKSFQVLIALDRLCTQQGNDDAGEAAGLTLHDQEIIDDYLRRAAADPQSSDDGDPL